MVTSYYMHALKIILLWLFKSTIFFLLNFKIWSTTALIFFFFLISVHEQMVSLANRNY